MVPAAASMTGVLMMPTGWMLPHPAPLDCGEEPMFFFQIVAPVASSRARTSLPVVTAKKTPFPPGPSARYRGDAHILPVKVALKPASLASVAATAVVRVGSTNAPSRFGCLLRSSTDESV